MVATTSLSKYEIERNKPMPSFNHGSIQHNISGLLFSYRKKYRISSEIKFRLPPENWESVPDISILPKQVLNLDKDIIAYPKPPLGTIEILSPTQSLTELTTKTKEYFRHGVKSCWIVIPQFRNIYIYSSPNKYKIFQENDMLVDKKLDISLSLKEVFE